MKARILCWLSLLAALLAPLPGAAQGSGEIRFEISTVAGLERHLAFLEHPGYLAVALENNGLSPSLSSKLVVRDRGREVEARIAVLRYAGREGSVYNYEVGLAIGPGSARSTLTFPVIVDLSSLAAAKAVVAVKPPLAALLPSELNDRIQIKMRMVANATAQKKIVDYLDQLARGVSQNAGPAALFESVLLDAYNRGDRPGTSARDAGDALPLSDQWMLILTLLIWAVAVPAAYFYRLRRRRGKPA
jgi:hypothetical protein